MDSQADQQGVCVQGAAGVVEGMEVEVKMDEGGGREVSNDGKELGG